MRQIYVQLDPKHNSLTGLLVALAIVLLWLSSLVFCLSLNIAQLSWWTLLLVWVRTFVQTGLFIVAHDAIHGSVVSGDRGLNRRIGQLSVALYAFLSYRKLSLNHWQHHRSPGQMDDPDFHDGIHRQAMAWYLNFMKGYLDARQMVILLFGMGTVFCTLQFGFHVAVANLFLFWVLPIILSSIQLFYFGTYLPHRAASESSDHPVITSSQYPLLWSFLTCYHFGYHWEHHQYPHLPWYHLPVARHQVHRSVDSGHVGRLPIFALLFGSPSH
jgi:beta-carotene/zeaxanthin 4-ketolase